MKSRLTIADLASGSESVSVVLYWFAVKRNEDFEKKLADDKVKFEKELAALVAKHRKESEDKFNMIELEINELTTKFSMQEASVSRGLLWNGSCTVGRCS